MFKFFKEDQGIERGTLIISLTTLVASILGVVKNSFLAATFGASRDLDIYFAAFRIPDFLYSILVFSTLSSSFLPIFSQLILAGKEKIWQLLSSLMLVFSVALGAMALGVVLFSPAIVEFLAPGFSSQDQLLLASLLRILMLQPIFLAISNLVAITLQGFKRFFVSSLAPVFYNLGIIVGAVFLARPLGIYGVVWGVILGAVLHLLIQLPGLLKLGFRIGFSYAEIKDSLREMLVLMLPRSLTIAAKNVIFFWITIVASLLPAGSLAVYNFSDSIQSLPQTVLALAFITATFPFLSEAWAGYLGGQTEGKVRFSEIFHKTAREILQVMVAATVTLAVFSPLVVKLLLGYGSFSPQDERLTVLSLLAFCVGLPLQALLMYLVRVFFAMRDTKNPFFSVLFASLLVVPAIWFWGVRWGVLGIALAMSLEAWLNSIYLLLVLRRQLGRLNFSELGLGCWRGLQLGLVTALPGGGVYYLFGWLVKPETSLLFAFQVVLAGFVALMGLFVATYFFRLFDLKSFFSQARKEELTSVGPDGTS